MLRVFFWLELPLNIAITVFWGVKRKTVVLKIPTGGSSRAPHGDWGRQVLPWCPTLGALVRWNAAAPSQLGCYSSPLTQWKGGGWFVFGVLDGWVLGVGWVLPCFGMLLRCDKLYVTCMMTRTSNPNDDVKGQQERQETKQVYI